MDWFSWLSKTGLEPSVIYEYGVAFANNELEEEDIAYFNHEFLQSMGISIAKHRLEILKLAKKEKGGKSSRPIARLLSAVKKSQRCLSRYISRWIRREESALVVVSRPNYGSRWKGALLKRNNKKLGMLKQGRLMLTYGSSKVSEHPAISYGTSPIVYDHLHNKDKVSDDDDDGYWSSTVGVEEIRWDAMFQNLKPT
ncbi:Sterile alpha motif (SAM) domain-containing protein [Thalictrum thalictroides]|uniref:Sterile alpha motif (SAM) domain-containing protein n=1 Tax=Thalictrum thalictroides TaxID=46969 RepID=A0A7J6V8E8_THATH|nr:Sterile alpha motif (SAM) domain-containing protein [Thalictrum thalictroides]